MESIHSLILVVYLDNLRLLNPSDVQGDLLVNFAIPIIHLLLNRSMFLAVKETSRPTIAKAIITHQTVFKLSENIQRFVSCSDSGNSSMISYAISARLLGMTRFSGITCS